MSRLLSIGVFNQRAAAASSYLLDTYGTGIEAAISTSRILKTGVTDCLTVRRSTGGETTYTPAQIVAGDHITYVGAGNDGFVTSAIDQSGNGRDLIQTTTSSQPKIVKAGTGVTANSKPAIEFDGTAQTLATATFAAGSADRSYIVVVRVDLNTRQAMRIMEHSNAFFDSNRNGIGKYFTTANQVQGMIGTGSANTRTNTFTPNSSTVYIFEVYVSSGNYMKFYQNGTLVHDLTTASVPETVSRVLTIGGTSGSGTDNRITLLEALYWSANKFSDRAAIYTDLSTYYA